MGMTFDRTKFRELLLYVAQKSAADESFGATKLNKLLFFADFIAYAQFGEPLTGATYQKLPQGPAPRELMPLRREMEQSGEAVVVERDYYGRIQHRFVARRPADISCFSQAQLVLVDELIRQFTNVNATAVSNLSHRVSIGWQLAEERESIPYETALLDDAPLTDEDVRAGQEIAAGLGLLIPA